MARDHSEPLDSVTFYCKSCSNRFSQKPDFIEQAPEETYHPYLYYAKCTVCEKEVGQAHWERNLLKGWANATGPKTADGKANSAANLDGHPTQEEALRTRFNAMKHGLNAKVANYFPARPGKYPHCDGCEFLLYVCAKETACLKRTELFLRHQIAFDTKDPSKLMGLRAETQAAVQALINDMILVIAQDGGPRIKEPVWYHDKDGGFHMAGYTDELSGEFIQYQEIKAHPLLKTLIDFINKNSMTLADMEMTPKVQDEQSMLRGFIDQQKPGSEESLEDYRSKTSEQLANLRGMIEKSQEETKQDPIFLEFQEVENNG